MSGKMSTEDMIGLLTTEGLLSEEFGILYDNPRFRDSIPKITKFCLTTAGQQLKLPKTAILQLDFYTDVVVMIKEVNNLEKTESDRSSLIYNKLVSLFSKYGITVDKGTVNLL